MMLIRCIALKVTPGPAGVCFGVRFRYRGCVWAEITRYVRFMREVFRSAMSAEELCCELSR